MRILFSRHGEAATGFADHERPLTNKGIKEVKNCANLIRKMGISPKYIISSPLARAEQTAAIYESILNPENKRFSERFLSPGGNAEEIAVLIKSLNADMLLVGHQPDISGYVTYFTSPYHYNTVFYPGTIASVLFDSDPQRERGVLEFLLKPF